MLCCSCLCHHPKWVLFCLNYLKPLEGKLEKWFVISKERIPRALICIWSLLFCTNGLWEILCHPSLHRPLNPLTFICSFSDVHHCQSSHQHLMWGISYPDFLFFYTQRPRDPKIRLLLHLRNKKYNGYVRWKPFFLFFLLRWRRGKVKVTG